MREIFIRLCLVGAVGFIMAHNHPSGNPSLSGQDWAVYHACEEAGRLMGIPCLDFLVLGDRCFTSVKNEGVSD